MTSYTTILYFNLLIIQLYAFAYHFPPPKTGIVTPHQLNSLKLLTATAALLSFFLIIILPARGSSSILSLLIKPLGLALLLLSETLFLWTASTTKSGTLSVIFGKVTPARVITTGPFSYVRHPTYVSYASGWAGVAALVTGKHGLSSTWSVVMMGCVGAMCWLYEQGAVLEERQFLRGEEVASGQTVDKQVKDEYGKYARQVRYKWVPGIL